MLWRLGLSIILVIILNGCSKSVDYELPGVQYRLLERRKVVSAAIENSLQILLYAGLVRSDEPEIREEALSSCLDIIGWPDDIERGYAGTMRREEISTLKESSNKLLNEREELNRKIKHTQSLLVNGYEKYGRSHEILNWLKRLTLGMGVLFVLLLFIRKLF